MQVQARLLETQGFRDTVALLQAGQAQLRIHVRARQAASLQRSMRQCVEASRAQAARVRRIQRLKRFLDHSRGFMGADPQRMLDAAFLSPRHHSIPSHGDPATSDEAAAATRAGDDDNGAGERTVPDDGVAPKLTSSGEVEERAAAASTAADRQGHAEAANDSAAVAGLAGVCAYVNCSMALSSPYGLQETRACALSAFALASLIHGQSRTGAGAAAIIDALDSQAADAAAVVAADADEPGGGGSRVTQMVASAVQTLSQYAVHVHVACFAIFVSDFTLAAAVFPLGSLLYALVTVPRAAYWHALLIYAETLLVLQYICQVAFRAGCLVDVDRRWLELARRVGLHSSVVRDVACAAVTGPAAAARRHAAASPAQLPLPVPHL